MREAESARQDAPGSTDTGVSPDTAAARRCPKTPPRFSVSADRLHSAHVADARTGNADDAALGSHPIFKRTCPGSRVDIAPGSHTFSGSWQSDARRTAGCGREIACRWESVGRSHHSDVWSLGPGDHASRARYAAIRRRRLSGYSAARTSDSPFIPQLMAIGSSTSRPPSSPTPSA